MEKYKIVKKLGEGAFGVVVKCVNTQNQEIVAIKKMKGQTTTWEDCLKMPEVKALQKLNNSPFLIKIREMVHNKKENEVNIVFEYCDKNLFQEMQDRARKNQSWNEQEIKTVMYQCVAAINYMHKNGYMHRDVKPENYLINNTSGPLASDQIQIKLADFGLAKDFRSGGSGKFTEYVATRWYRAPELVLRTPNYNQSVDIFALGAIMAELYLGRPIFPGVNETDQLTRIVTVLGTPSSSEWPEGIQLAQQKGIQIPQVFGTSLRQHFASRVDISDEAFDLMAKMFKYSSDQRITAAQCLKHEFFRDVSQNLKNMGNGMNMNQINQRRFQRNQQRLGQIPESDEVLAVQRQSKEHLAYYPVSRGGEASPPVVTSYNINLGSTGTQIIQNSPEQKQYNSKIGGISSNRLENANQNGGSGMTYGALDSAPVTLPTSSLISSRRAANPTGVAAGNNYKPSFNKSLRQSQNRDTMGTQEDSSVFAPRMSKYGQGAFGANLGSGQFDVSKNSMPNPYSNLGGTADLTGLSSLGKKPEIQVSKMQRNNKPILSGTSNNGADDYLGKMLNQDEGLYKNIGMQQTKPNISSKPNILVKQHKVAGSMIFQASNPPQHSEPLTASQSVGMLPGPRSGSRLDNDQQQAKDAKGQYGGQARGLGGIGQNIMSGSAVDYKAGKEGSRGSYAAIPVLKPSMIIPAEKGQQPKPNHFSNLGQSLIMSSNTAMYQPGTTNNGPVGGSRNESVGLNNGISGGDYNDLTLNNNRSQYMSSTRQPQQNR